MPKPSSQKQHAVKLEPESAVTQPSAKRPPRVLLAGCDQATRDTLIACANQGEPFDLVLAKDTHEAMDALVERGPIDLVLTGEQLGEEAGLSLVSRVNDSKKLTQCVLLSASPTLTLAVDAMRAGACDVLSLPLEMEDANTRVRAALAKQRKSKAPVRRVRKLRRLCKKLNQARLDVSAQVDILCNDLVTAYQELADQMQQVVQGSEFGALLKNELDLEESLRTTLEFFIQKAGPTNAAIFLPATMDEYSLGGYVNYDCPGDSADILLDHLADVVAPRMTDREDVAHILNNEQMDAWIGDDAAYLADSELIAFAARHEDEALAVVVLFRDNEQPFDRTVMDVCNSAGPILGEALARIIRVHHRHLPDLMDEEFGEGYDGTDGDDDALPF